MVQEVAGSSPVFHPFFLMLESNFTCPHCWENQLKMVDPSIEFQRFIEDCEVCCNPIEFTVKVQESEFVEIIPCSIEQ